MGDFFITHEILAGAGVRHGFFGRKGGVSKGLYRALNCGLGSADDQDCVRENRALVARALGGQELVTLHQVHSAEAVLVRAPFDAGEQPQADAVMTDRPDLVIGVLTADCAPVLLRGTDTGGRAIIGAAHAGWGGAVRGILESTVTQMREMGAERIKAAVGPCIGPQSYEVSADFPAPFLLQDPGNERFFKQAARAGHLMFDLPAYVAHRLRLLDVEVGVTGVDTYAREDDYFSYRRATHRKEPDYGRQVAAIMIAGDI